ncbi:MAG: two-component system repressor protein LuxO [Phenylobacterium sp.]
MSQSSPNNKNPRVLLIEDSTSQALIYLNYLKKSGYEASHVATGGAGLMHIKENTPELVLLDLELPDIPGMSILKYITDNQLPSTVIIITGHGTINVAVEAMQTGAFDFLTKPFDARRFNTTVKNALALHNINQNAMPLKVDLNRKQYQGFIGGSDAMQQVYQMIDNVAVSKASIFICGESGTGKELCAEAVHQKSARSDQPFMALNCASIPKELMESEFFGHVKGAFTGAHTERVGAVEQADGGTLFLDEICEMDLELQSKLLRFIQTGVYRKVGSSQERQVDIRFVCATNRSPLEEVAKGNFREDLYYRLHVIPLNLPPLRDRALDVILIANHLLKIYAGEENKIIQGFSSEAEDILLSYQWPGNVRQMQNIIRLIAVLNNVEWITPELLPAPLNTVQVDDKVATLRSQGNKIPQSADRSAEQVLAKGLAQRSLELAETEQTATAQPSAEPALKSDIGGFESKAAIEPFGVYERKIIEAAISSCDGNVPEAAAQLALSPSTLYRKIQSWKSEK